MKNIQLNRKETSFEEMKEIIESPDTIILNDGIKKRVSDMKSRESIMNRKKIKRTSEVWSIIENIVIGAILVGLMIFIWLVGINKTDALEAIKPIEKQDIKIEQVAEKIVVEIVEEKVVYTDVEEEAFNFIAKFEGYHDKPYWDYKQYSCGYGLRCDKNTTGITKEKSKKFVIERINAIRERHELHKYDDKMEVALISFIYNIGHSPIGMERYINNNHINALKNMMKKYSYAGGKYMRGLHNRRITETNLF